MYSRIRYILAALAGAAAGYACMTIAANLEDWQFYTIRSLVIGRSAMSEIVAHPADKWIVPVLLVVFVSLGATLGVCLARLGKSILHAARSETSSNSWKLSVMSVASLSA